MAELEPGWTCRVVRGVKHYYFRDKLTPRNQVPQSIQDYLACEAREPEPERYSRPVESSEELGRPR